MRQLLAVVLVGALVTAAYAAPPKSASLVIKEGDAVGASVASALNTPFTNGNGKVGFLGSTLDGDRYIWYDTGPVWFNSSDTINALSGGEGTMGIGNSGEFAYSPSINGADGAYGNNGIIAVSDVQAPDFPAGTNSTFHSRPRMINDGTAYWISGFDDTGGTSTKGRMLYKQTQGGTPQVVVRSDDVINGETVARSSGVDFDYHISGGGLSRINVFQMATGSTSNDDRVVANGVTIAGETWPTGQGDNWDNFDHVSINDSGNFLFSGDTDGATASDEFIAYNGVIAIREGAVIDGVTLGSSVNAMSINELNQAVFTWSTNLTETLFFGDAAALASSVALLSVGDEIDVTGDAISDWVITDFNASGVIGPGLDLAEDGYVYVEIDMEPVGGGAEIEAIIGVLVPEPTTIGLLLIGGFALLRRRR